MSQPHNFWEDAIQEWHHRRYFDEDFTPKSVAREYSKDYDRVLYSTAFRRLGGVTQVAASSEIALFHNRLTHALKTAQVGARIANHLRANYYTNAKPGTKAEIDQYGGIEPRVVRAACLAYNLGRPPFGHTAVQELRRITSEPNTISPKRTPGATGPVHTPEVVTGYLLHDKFSESAQAFRIVTKLAFRESAHKPGDCPALNLTRGTLAAMLKYPWAYDARVPLISDTSQHWGFYDSELETVKWVLGDQLIPPSRSVGSPGRTVEYRTVEAQVMDWADDISYAIHDVEDFFRVGLIPLNYLALSDDEWEQFFAYAWDRKLRKLFDNDLQYVWGHGQDIRQQLFPKTPYVGSQEDRIALHKFASSLIKEATDKTSIVADGIVNVEHAQLCRIELLKQLTWYYVIERPSLESLQRGQRVLIRSLYNHLIEWVEEVWDGKSLPRRPLVEGKDLNSILQRLSERRKINEVPARLLEYLDIVTLHDPVPRSIPGNTDPNRQLVSRAVVDYISSLTELQAVTLAARLNGQSTDTMLDTWFLP